MNLSTGLETRSAKQCELCTATHELTAHLVEPKTGQSDDDYAVLCSNCITELQHENLNEDHWRCLNESIWSPMINMMYMEETTVEWAESSMDQVIHKDSNGHQLQNGDSVTLIKDLNVKGAGFTAKRGTAVRRISLVQDNPEHIQGRINDQTIIILTKYVKKS